MGNILGGVLGGLMGGGNNPVMTIAQMVLGSQGGLGGLVEKFTKGGLGDMVSSWVSTGPNPPITPAQVGKVFSPGDLKDLADKHFGGDHAAATSALSKYLPDIVDKLTPHGALPQGTDWMSNIGGLLGGLMK